MRMSHWGSLLGGVLGTTQSSSAGNETGLIGTAYWVVPWGATQSGYSGYQMEASYN